jgi:hypothetical protein
MDEIKINDNNDDELNDNERKLTELQKLLGNNKFDDILTILKQYKLSIRFYKNLYRVSIDRSYEGECKSSDEHFNILKECRGIILEKDTNKLISYGLNNFIDPNDIEWSKPFIIEESIEGTLIKLYWNPFSNRWIVATNRTINAKWGHWISNRDFFHLFMDIGKRLDYDKLDKNCTYSFVLKHPENRIVRRYKKVGLNHIHTRNINTLEEIDDNVYFQNGNIVSKPRKYDFKTKDDVYKELDNLPFFLEGYIITDSNGNKSKILNPKHTEISTIRGNVNNIEYRYLELRNDPELLNKFFNTHYKEYNRIMIKMNNKIDKLAEQLHRYYITKFVDKHSINKVEWEKFKDILNVVFLKYKSKEINKINKDVFLDEFKKINIDQLANLLNIHRDRFFKEKS